MAAKYIRLANRLKEQIDQNRGIRSYKLPTENELSELYSVSRQTVRLALSLLTEEGYIKKRQGSGSYALPPAVRNQNKEYAILLSSDSEYLYPSILMSLQSTIRATGNHSSLYLTHSSPDKERYILESLLHTSIEGIYVEGIQTNLPNPNLDLYEQLLNQKKRITFIQYPYPSLSEVPSFRMDDFYGGYMVGKHLLSRQHTRIAAIFQADSLNGTERYAGLNSALKDVDIILDMKHVAWYSTFQYLRLQKEQDTDFLKEFIKKQLVPCSCVVCQNDEIAYWLVKELLSAGYQIPVDISILSFGNTYLSDLSYPQITSLAPRAADFSVIMQDAIQTGQPVDHVFSWRLSEKGSVSFWHTD